MSVRSMFCCFGSPRGATSTSYNAYESAEAVLPSARQATTVEYARPSVSSNGSSPQCALDKQLHRAIRSAGEQARSGMTRSRGVTLDLSKVREDVLDQLTAPAVDGMVDNLCANIETVQLPARATRLPDLPFPNLRTLVVPESLGQIDLRDFRQLRAVIASGWTPNEGTRHDEWLPPRAKVELEAPPRPSTATSTETESLGPSLGGSPQTESYLQRWLSELPSPAEDAPDPNSQFGSSSGRPYGI